MVAKEDFQFLFFTCVTLHTLIYAAKIQILYYRVVFTVFFRNCKITKLKIIATKNFHPILSERIYNDRFNYNNHFQ